MNTLHRYGALLAGPVIFGGVLMLLNGLFSFSQAVAIGLIFWMGIWWILRPVSITVTSLLPLAINAVFDLVPMVKVTGQYFSDIIVLILASDLISHSWASTGLDKRLALKALSFMGNSLTQQICVWLSAATLLSIFLPNVIVTSILTPVAISMLAFVGDKDIRKSKLAIPILLAIVWGAGIGGFGSPIGGVANLVIIHYLEQLIGHEFMYLSWIPKFFPFLIAVFGLNLLYIYRMPTEIKTLPGSKAFCQKLYAEIGSISKNEIFCLVVFLAATVLSFIRPVFAEALPGMKPAYIFLLMAFAFFILPVDSGKPLLRWEDIEKKVMWGLLILYGGGLALGAIITNTGAAQRAGELLTLLPIDGGIGTVFIFNTFSTIMTEVSSNTSAAAIAMPVVISTAESLHVPPIGYAVLASICVNCAYMLPVSIRAIPVSHGLDAAVLFRYGFKLSLYNIILVTMLGYLAIIYWPGFVEF